MNSFCDLFLVSFDNFFLRYFGNYFWNLFDTLLYTFCQFLRELWLCDSYDISLGKSCGKSCKLPSKVFGIAFLWIFLGDSFGNSLSNFYWISFNNSYRNLVFFWYFVRQLSKTSSVIILDFFIFQICNSGIIWKFCGQLFCKFCRQLFRREISSGVFPATSLGISFDSFSKFIRHFLFFFNFEKILKKIQSFFFSTKITLNFF